MIHSLFCLKISDDSELNLLNLDDSEEFFYLMDSNRDFLEEWLPRISETKTISDSKSFITLSLQKFDSGTAIRGAIRHRGKIAGTAGFKTIDPIHRKAEIYYWLGESFQGKGLVTLSIKSLIDYGFNILKLNRLELQCGKENFRSIAVAERLGFTLEGVIRQAELKKGGFADNCLYSLLYSDWSKK